MTVIRVQKIRNGGAGCNPPLSSLRLRGDEEGLRTEIREQGDEKKV